MVNLLTGPKGSGKTQQMIELANQQAKACNGNVVFIKNSHRDTSSVTFDIRVVCMDDYEAIKNIDEYIGFLYGMYSVEQSNAGLHQTPDLKARKNRTVDGVPEIVSVLRPAQRAENQKAWKDTEDRLSFLGQNRQSQRLRETFLPVSFRQVERHGAPIADGLHLSQRQQNLWQGLKSRR